MDSEFLVFDGIEQEIAQQRRGLVAFLSAASLVVWSFAAFASAGALV